MPVEKLDTFMQIMTWFSDNWEVLTGTALAIIAGADKVAMVALKTAKNILDEWHSTFGDRRE